MFNKRIFCSRLKQLRINNNLSLAALAAEIGLKSRSAVGHWESGLNVPPADVLVTLADRFDVSLDYLTGRSKLFDLPEGSFSYQFEDSSGKKQQGNIKYTFGMFPLENTNSGFLFLEEAGGSFLKEACANQLNFLALVAFVNDSLNLNYRFSNPANRINLIIKTEEVPLPQFQEITKDGAVTVFIGYETFIIKYLEMTIEEKITFLNSWLAEPSTGVTYLESLKSFFKKL